MRPVAPLIHLALCMLLATGCSDYSTTPDILPPSQSVDGLWTVSGNPPAILRLDPTQLGASGDRTPSITVTTTSAGLSTLVAVAFGPDGRLWLASADDSRLLAFAPDALATSGARTAAVVISSTNGSLSTPTGLAFDSARRLWVANRENGTLIRLDPDQQGASGAATPAVVLSGVGQPTALAFDAEGSLWVSENPAHRIIGYHRSQLTVSGSPAPAVVLTAANGSLMNPTGLAFDASGNLWVSNAAGATIVAFSPGQLATSGSPTPRIVLSSNAGSFSLPVALAFDQEGSLWVVGATGMLTKFARTDLGTSGAPIPASRLSLVGHSLLWGVALRPRSNDLPLN